MDYALRSSGYAIDWVKDGSAALTAVRAQRYDAILLDLGLPMRDGLDVLRTLRGNGDATPVLIVTARDALESRVAGLGLRCRRLSAQAFRYRRIAGATARDHPAQEWASKLSAGKRACFTEPRYARHYSGGVTRCAFQHVNFR